MPITAKCLITAIGMLLKHIFRGSQINQKTPPFLYDNPLNGFTKNTRWWLNKILKKGPAGHP
jgi:membrane-associated PAP2 superfamily phosphatase